ncbi:MAG: HutD family protein [Nannocystis sp.]|nr:HutD family protein [Nannocystis sp.]MBA3546730.1 HutD family protein [Nannocystis sp.]
MHDAPEIVRLRQADYQRMRWKNGAGWTTEIAQTPADDGGFVWRVSIAEVEADAAFSAFPDVDRSLLVLAGEGMVLTFEDGASALLRPLAEALAFPGEARVHARLLGGPTRDFNVMTRRGSYTHSLALHRPGEPLTLTRSPRRSWLVHVLAGAAAGVGAGDSFLLPAGADAPLTIAGEATLVVVGFHRRTATG